MSRGLAANNVAEVNKSSLGLAMLFAELDFTSGFVRAHTALGTIKWGGYDWLGVGTFANVSTVEESAELSKSSLTYTLNGIPSSMISIVLGEQYQGRSAKLYIGFLDPTTGQLVADPNLLSQGRMDVSEIEEGDTCTVSITAESRVAAWDRPLTRRYTDADQRSRYVDDKGLQYIDQAAQKEINWGRKTQ